MFVKLKFLFLLLSLIFLVSCSEQNTLQGEKDIITQFCEIADGKWRFIAPPKGKTEIDCKKGDCRNSISLMRLKCETNKVSGKQFRMVNSMSGESFWDDISSKFENNQIILTTISYSGISEEESKVVGKQFHKIQKIKDDRLYGEYIIDAFPESKNQMIENRAFIAIKNQ